MKLKIAICDDEQDQTEYLSGIVSAWANKNRHVVEVKTYSTAKSFLFDYSEDKDFDILLLDIEMVGLFIPDLLKGKEPRRTKHIPKVPKILVFTRNFVTRKEYDYGKVHH